MRKSNLTRIVINISKANARVAAVISAPQARSATENFESVIRLLQAPKGSVVAAGDTILDQGNYYALGYFNITHKDLVFRMFITPEEGKVKRRQIEQDPVTGYDRQVEGVLTEKFRFSFESRGQKQDVGDYTSLVYRLISGFPLIEGDIILPQGLRVRNVRHDNGIYYTEAVPQ